MILGNRNVKSMSGICLALDEGLFEASEHGSKNQYEKLEQDNQKELAFKTDTPEITYYHMSEFVHS